MRNAASLLGALLLVASAQPALAGPRFEGSYTSTGSAGTVTLTVQQRGQQVTGTLTDPRGSVMRIEGNAGPHGLIGTATFKGHAIPLVCNPSGEGLVLKLQGVQTPYRFTPIKRTDPNPLGASADDNPLASPSWVGTYVKADGSIRLVVSSGSGGLQGLLEIGRGETHTPYPIAWTSTGSRLEGTFASDSSRFPVTLERSGPGFVLTSGSHRHELQLQRTPARGAESATTPATARPAAARPKPSEPTIEFRDPTGSYTAKLPKGWRAMGVAGGNHQVHTDAPGAYVLLLLGTVDEEDLGLRPARILRGDLNMMSAFCRQQLNVTSRLGEATVHDFSARTPGAYAKWPGSTQGPEGRVPLTVFNGFVVREHIMVMVLATVLEGKEAQFLPRIQRMLASIQIQRVPSRAEIQTLHQDTGQRTADPLPRTEARQNTSSRQVTFNRRKLDDATLAALERGMGIVIPNGDYWYDRTLGAIGSWGGPTFAFFPPGLNLGSMTPNCSGGGTGVFVNGRELHRLDVAGLRSLVGTVYRGHWWLLPNGTYGRVGQGATGNLFLLAQQAGRRGGSRSGGSQGWTRYSDYGGGGTHFGSFGNGDYYFSSGTTSWWPGK